MVQPFVLVYRRYIKDKKNNHRRFAECSGLHCRLDGKGDPLVSVESNPSFHVQPYEEWPGLVEQIQAAYIEDVYEPDVLVPSGSSDCSSGDSSDSGDEHIIDIGMAAEVAGDVDDSDDAEDLAAAPHAVAAVLADAGAAVGCDPSDMATVEDVVRQLTISKGKGNLQVVMPW